MGSKYMFSHCKQLVFLAIGDLLIRFYTSVTAMNEILI